MSTQSSSVLASASNATINVFDTVANAATSVTKIINGIGTGANMFERMMQDMDTNHAMRSKVNQASYKKELIEDTSFRMAKRQRTIQSELQSDNDLTNLYREAETELKTLLG